MSSLALEMTHRLEWINGSRNQRQKNLERNAKQELHKLPFSTAIPSILPSSSPLKNLIFESVVQFATSNQAGTCPRYSVRLHWRLAMPPSDR